MNNIREAIRRLAQSDGQTVSLVCTVDAVDKTARTVDCTPLDGSAPLLGVNLQANQGSKFGTVSFPKVSSYVVVGFVADGRAGVVLLTDEVESIEVVIDDNIRAELSSEGIMLNGGGFGGLVEVERLTERLNAIENDINILKKAFSGWIIKPQDGGESLSMATKTWSANLLELTKRSDYENEKVKHG